MWLRHRADRREVRSLRALAAVRRRVEVVAGVTAPPGVAGAVVLAAERLPLPPVLYCPRTAASRRR